LAWASCRVRAARGGAREAFSKTHTCPEERIEVRRRADLIRSKLGDMRKPPPEVQADPARLKMWQAEQDRINKSVDAMCELYEARGCGHQELMCCFRPAKRMNRVSCSTEKYPDGVSKW
jgi:hypothetical protein